MRCPLAQLLALAATAFVSACAGEATDPGPPGFLELPRPDGEADATPPIADILARVPAATTFEADFARERNPGSWLFVGTRGQPEQADGLLRIRATADSRAIWELPIDTADTTHLAVRFGPAGPPKQLHVYWQPAGEEGFPLDRSRFAPASSERTPAGELLVPLARRSSWTGRVRALALVFQEETTVEIAGVRGLDARSSIAGWLAADPGPDVAAVPTAVEVRRLRRPALRVAPRSALVQRVAVEEGTELSLGLALHPVSAYLSSSRTRFAVSVRRGGTTEVLAEREVPGDGRPGDEGWHDLRIPLDRFAGGEVELVLSTEPLHPALPTGAPLWAEPRLVRADARRDGPNLVLISVDTLRADHLESYGYEHVTAPELAALAADGVLFRHCLSHAPSTLPSHGALFAGVPAHANRMDRAGGHRVPADTRLLAEMLREAGLATAAFAGGGYFDPHYGLSQGFDTYSYAKTGLAALDYSDVEFNVERATQWLAANHDRRFFLFLHTYEVHGPFDPRAEHVERYLPPDVPPPGGTSDMRTNARKPLIEPPDFHGWRDLVTPPDPTETSVPTVMQQIVATYDSEIRATDEYVGRLLATLAELGLEEDTLVVFTSDHGEAFLEHGRIGHGHLYENNLRVPLALRLPGRLPAGLVVEDRVQLADVVPTCLDLLGVPVPGEVRGTSLVPRMVAGEALPNRAIVSYSEPSGISYVTPDGRKLIVNVLARNPRAGRRELYDLTRDPDELVNLYDRLAPEEVRALEERIEQVLAEIPGTHVLVAAETELAFEGTLRLEGSHAPLPRQLRSFPLEPAWFAFPERDRVDVTTAPLERWLVHLHQGDGLLHLDGTVRDSAGRVAQVAERIDLGALDRNPVVVELRDGAGQLLGRLLATVVDPVGGAAEGDGPSAETLRQLENLGYL